MIGKFFLVFFLVLFSISCVSPQVQLDRNSSDFYLALLTEETDTDRIRLFENSLTNSNEYIRRAAADNLAVIMANGAELSPATLEKIKNEASPWWKAAFEASSDKSKALLFLLEHDQSGASYSHARNFLLQECEENGIFFDDIEIAVIEGRFSSTRLRYAEALDFFRAMSDDGWPENLPQIFIEYPALINELGRSFQYTTQSRNEGITLFSGWEANVPSQLIDIRYRLLFYNARIMRSRGQSTQALNFFERALSFAPDTEQSDACLWYIYDLALSLPASSRPAVVFLEKLEQYVPLWHNGSAFNDVLERYLHQRLTARDWGSIITVFSLIKETGADTSIAGSAWMIARAFQEGYLTPNERRLAAAAVNNAASEVYAFMTAAYNASTSVRTPALYYRMKSAEYLELPFLVYNDEVNEIEATPALQFINGFFVNNAEGFLLPYLRALQGELSSGELRSAAQILNEAENIPLSLEMVNLYINRQGYIRTRQDFELLFPRAFSVLVEEYAEIHNMEPYMLFALIRTESAFRPAAISHAGAVGLTQLMPATARDMADRIRRAGGPDFVAYNNLDCTDPYVNVFIGTYYFNYLMERFDDPVLSLLGYNGGPTRVRNWLAATTFPPDLFIETVPIYETRDYGRRVPGVSAVYKELYY